MSFARVITYGELKRIDGRPLVPVQPCPACGRDVRLGEVDLTVEFAASGPYPDVLGVLFGPEMVVSERFREAFEKRSPGAAEFVPVTLSRSGGNESRWSQILPRAELSVGRESVKEGVRCNFCPGSVRVKIDPLFIVEPSEDIVIARLREVPAVVIIQAALAELLRGEGMDFDTKRVYYEGELPEAAMSGISWGDL